MIKNDHLLFFSAAFVFALNMIFFGYAIDKIPVWAACLLLSASIVALARAEKETVFNLSQLWQISFPLIYLAGFSWLLHYFGYFTVISSEISRQVNFGLLIKLAAMAIGAAVFEEIFFRKFLLDLFQKTMSKRTSLILTSLAFQAAHFSLLPTLFIDGLFWGHLTLRYKSILAAVTLHAMYDMVGFSIQKLTLPTYKLDNALSIPVMLHSANAGASIIAMLCLLIGLFSMWVFNKVRKINSEMQHVKSVSNL